MDCDDYEKFWIPACERLFDVSWSRGSLSSNGVYELGCCLDEALGLVEFKEYYGRPSLMDSPCNAKLRDLLKALGSPHGKTVLKMYQIRKGIK